MKRRISATTTKRAGLTRTVEERRLSTAFGAQKEWASAPAGPKGPSAKPSLRGPKGPLFHGAAGTFAMDTAIAHFLKICLAAALVLFAASLTAQDMPRFRWENFTTANGLPDNHVFCVLVDGNRIWAGTENGLGLYEKGAWKIFRPADGMAHQAVLSLARDKNTGDIWAGTMGGLSRVSAGRIDTFTQLNSGLSNDVVYGVGVQGDFVWTA